MAFINSDRGKPSFTPPPLGSGSKNSEHLLEVYDRIKTFASMMKGLGCGPDVDIGIDNDLIVTGIAFLLRRELH